MKFRFHPEAALEFEDSVDYYERVSPGLGVRFAKEVYAAIESVSKFA